MTNSQKVFAAVLAGAAAGVITGLLLAPDKGSETRKRIVDTGRKTFDSVKDLANSSWDTVTEMKEKFLSKNDRRGSEHAESRTM
jgi:gas vesicle protein